MTYISQDSTAAFSNLYPSQEADFVGTAAFYEESTNPQTYTNNNLGSPSGTGASTFDVTGVNATAYILGDTVDSKITYTTAAEVNWDTGGSVAQICGNYDNLLGSNLVSMYQGTVEDTGKACVSFDYTVGNDDDSVVLISQKIKRQCFYCTGVSGTTQTWTMKTFKTPVTSTRKVSGLSVWTADTSRNTRYTPSSTATTTVMFGGTATECGHTSSIQKQNLGQQVIFKVKTPVPLAPGFVLYFMDQGSVEFKFNSTSGSAVIECGTTKITGVSINIEATQFTATIPTPSGYVVNTAVCAKDSLVTLTVREWTSTTLMAVNITEMDAGCYICDQQCTSTQAKTDSFGVAKYDDTKSFKFAQNGTKEQPFLEIQNMAFLPDTYGSYGRFYFEPKVNTPVKLYSGSSVLEYTFGSMDFGTGTVCQVKESYLNKPSDIKFSDSVASCQVSGAKVTVTLGKDLGSADFFVDILNTGAMISTDTTINGNLQNYGTKVQLMNVANLTVFKALEVKKPGSLKVTLKKQYTRTMDVGYVQFEIEKLTILEKWDKDGHALIQFPTYYAANIGEGFKCSLVQADGSTEDLYCKVVWDWSLKVYGPV